MTLPDEPRTLPKRTPQNFVVRVVAMPPRLDDPLAERLRLAHHRLRVDGLVRGDEHEALRAELDGDVGNGARDEGVVADGLERVRLHERHVLVGRGMEDDRGPVLLEDLPHLRRVAGIREDGGRRVEVALVDELALDLEEARLAVVDEHEPGRAHPCDLPAQLGSDRAAGSGDEHHLAGEVAGDRREIDLDGLASEEVLDADRPDLARKVEVPGDELVEARERVHRDASSRATSTIRSRTSPDADGIAMRSSSGRRSRRSSRSSAVVPRTRIPWSRRFFFRGSSSTSPIGV